MNFLKRDLHSLSEILDFAKDLLPQLQLRQILLLEGPMGVGKTEFVRALIRILNRQGQDEVSSPSFAIHNVYETKFGSTVDHLDLYRVENEDDLESTGFWDLFSKKRGLIVIEWSERLEPDLLPRSWSKLKIRFEFDPAGHRRVEVLKL